MSDALHNKFAPELRLSSRLPPGDIWSLWQHVTLYFKDEKYRGKLYEMVVLQVNMSKSQPLQTAGPRILHACLKPVGNCVQLPLARPRGRQQALGNNRL